MSIFSLSHEPWSCLQLTTLEKGSPGPHPVPYPICTIPPDVSHLLPLCTLSMTVLPSLPQSFRLWPSLSLSLPEAPGKAKPRGDRWC